MLWNIQYYASFRYRVSGYAFFLYLALTDRNIQVKFGLKRVLEFWDGGIFETANRFFNTKQISIRCLVTCYCIQIVPKIWNKSKFTKEEEICANWTIDGIYSIKTGCSFQNVHISGFQNSLQTKFDLYISVCQSQIKKKQKHNRRPCTASSFVHIFIFRV